MSRPRPALVVFWVSVAVLIAAVLMIGINRWQAVEDADVESIGTRPDFSTTPTSSPTPTPSSTSPSPSPTPSGPFLVSVPTRLSIPAIDVDTRIYPVALQPDGAIEIPEDIRYVGWYRLGVPPGVNRGSAVLVAHRDGRTQGRGVFYDLGNLKPGDRILVTTAAKEQLPYEVVSREFITKKGLPYEELFAVDGAHRLTLISCGGAYDRDNGGYQDNVVVTAVPLFTPIAVNPADPNAKPSYAPTPSATNASESASPSPSPSASPSPTKPSKAPKPPTFSNKPTKKPTPTPTPMESSASPEPEPSASAAPSADQPVDVSVPGAGTVEEGSTPVLLGGN